MVILTEGDLEWDGVLEVMEVESRVEATDDDEDLSIVLLLNWVPGPVS